MALFLRLFGADTRAQLMEPFQSALTSCLGFFIPFVNYPIGKLPWNRNHADVVLPLQFLKRIPHLFTPQVSAADPQQTVTIVQHRLDDLHAVPRLYLGEPNQSAASAIDR